MIYLSVIWFCIGVALHLMACRYAYLLKYWDCYLVAVGAGLAGPLYSLTILFAWNDISAMHQMGPDA